MKKIMTLFAVLAMLLSLCACTVRLGPASPEEPNPEASRGPTWQEQYDLGVRYLSQGNYAEAILAFTAAIEIDPRQAPAYVGRGDAYVLSGETEDNLSAAKADYEKAIELDESSADAYLGLADVYIRQGDYEKALEILREGLSKTGDNRKIADKIEEMERGSIKDSSGQLRRENGYDATGALAWYHTYDYDANGVRTAVTWFDGQGNQKGHIDESYTQDGKVLRGLYTTYMDDGTMTIGDYQYDAEGNLTRVDEYDLENNWNGYRLYENGPDGVIRESWYDSNGTLTGYYQYEYEDGKTVKRSDFDGNGDLIYYIIYEYDANGHMTKLVNYNADHTFSGYWVFEWNEDGQCIASEYYDADGNLLYRTTHD